MKKTSMLVLTIVLCRASLRAQEPLRAPGDADIVSFGEAEQDAPAALQKIFSNLGKPTSAYSSGFWNIAGPVTAGEQSIAMNFKPKANAHVQQVRAAVQWFSGANQVNLSLYSDAGGAPGTLLAGPVTVNKLPTYFHCCKLAIANFTASVAVTAGTQYWVVADTPSTFTGSDFYGSWDLVPPTKDLVGFDHGSGWSEFQAYAMPAAAVYGTIP